MWCGFSNKLLDDHAWMTMQNVQLGQYYYFYSLPADVKQLEDNAKGGNYLVLRVEKPVVNLTKHSTLVN